MTWRTHMVVGANSIWLTAVFNQVDQTVLVLLPTAAFASLLPDIDAVFAKIHFIGGGVFGLFRGKFKGKYFHHRAIMHSFFAGLLFFLFFAVFFAKSIPLLPLIFFIAYMSHSVIDGFNTGVGFLYPFKRVKYALLPRAFRTPVNGVADNILFFIGSFSLLVFFWIFRTQFLPTSLNF